MGHTVGEQSIQFDSSVYLLGAGSVVGKKEGDGPLENILIRSEKKTVSLAAAPGRRRKAP